MSARHTARPRLLAGGRFGLLVASLFFAANASAEVSDKLLSAPELLIPAFVSALLAVVLVRSSAWWCLLTAPIGLFRVFGAATELLDPYLGPAIKREVGSAYLNRVVLALIVVLAGHCVAIYFNRHRAPRPDAGPRV
jgi:hypothetical protein